MNYHIEFDLDFKRNPYPGKFIVFEGIEASGKTTQARAVSEILEKDRKIWLTKNPTTDNEIGRFIRNEILSGNKKHIPPVSYQYLFSADRVIQQEQIIEKLKQGITVVCDRYFWSSVAYGIADREGTDYENWEEVSLIALSILSMYYQFLLPDLSIYLDVSLEESARRISNSTKHTEIYDNHLMNIKIKKGYDWLFKKFPEEIVILDAAKSEGEITKEMLRLIGEIKK
ncbi:MAG: dTMP kinase [Patescibacteria group bacterium]|nr:dTMP kinase [Patescibacteria group bacterium]